MRRGVLLISGLWLRFLFHVGAEEDHFASFGFDAAFLQNRRQTHTGPYGITEQTAHAVGPGGITRAFEGDSLFAFVASPLEIVERELFRMIDEPVDAKSPRRCVHVLGFTLVEGVE